MKVKTAAGRKITSVTYDDFGNPLRTSFSGGGYIENVYSATGERLRSVQAVRMVDPGTSLGFTARTTLQYRGPVVYRDGKIDMVLFTGGYATVDGTAVTFHYYTQDYLGNNRAVVNGTTGAVEQTVAYYPYGAVIADLGTASTSGQPYKFGGKELTAANGLNEYDFGARQYWPAVPGFTKPDPCCESFQHLSPYLFCGNDPVNNVDPSGMYIIEASQNEWYENKKDIEQKRAALQKSITETLDKALKNGWSQEKIDNSIGEKQLHLKSLSKTISTMSTIENSSTAYSLSHVDTDVGGISRTGENSIDIGYVEGDVGNFVHEVTHAGQVESGDLMLSESGAAIFYDIYDEFQAYAAQYAYAKSSNTNSISIKSYESINLRWLSNIKNSNGSFVYRHQIGVDCGIIPVSSMSNAFTLRTAYPRNVRIQKMLSNGLGL